MNNPLQKHFATNPGKMASIKYLKDKRRWQVRYHITCPSGEVLIGSRCFHFECNARDYKAGVEQEADRLRSGLTEPSETVVNAIGQWLHYNRRHTPRTQDHYQRVIRDFLDSLPATVIDIRQISSRHILAYLNQLLNCYKNRTANAHLTAIKSACRFLAEHYEIPNPAESVRMLREEPPKQRFLSPTEYKMVLEATEPRQRGIIEFLANTGLRAAEFTDLRWSDVSADHKQLTITGKGRKRRTIPLNRRCQEILSELNPKAKGSIWMSKSLKRPRWKLYSICKKASKAAGIRIFGPHSLRHYFATELLRRGVHISHVSQLLGHSSIRTTEQIYIHFVPEYLAGTTDVLCTDQ